jgi:hypothetical protein
MKSRPPKLLLDGKHRKRERGGLDDSDARRRSARPARDQIRRQQNVREHRGLVADLNLEALGGDVARIRSSRHSEAQCSRTDARRSTK